MVTDPKKKRKPKKRKKRSIPTRKYTKDGIPISGNSDGRLEDVIVDWDKEEGKKK